jgi:hypothetical protein
VPRQKGYYREPGFHAQCQARGLELRRATSWPTLPK